MGMPCSPGSVLQEFGPLHKVAIVRASRMGDFICATPAIRALRAALPDAHITFIGLPLVRALVERSPHLDRFVEFPGFPGMAEQFFNPRTAVRFFERMQAEGFDLAIQLHGSGVYSNVFALMLGARHTVGFVRPGEPKGRLDAATDFPERAHEVLRWLELARFLGAPDTGVHTEYPLWPADHAAAEKLLAGLKRPLIGLHPGARDESKIWPLHNFTGVGHELWARFGGTLVVLGSAHERQIARAVGQGLGPGRRCAVLAGRTHPGSLGAVIARLDLLIGNDSAPAHIAYALGTPSVTIFIDTDPAQWGPPVAGPHRVVGRGNGEPVAVDAVLAQAEAVLRQGCAEARCGSGVVGEKLEAGSRKHLSQLKSGENRSATVSPWKGGGSGRDLPGWQHHPVL